MANDYIKIDPTNTGLQASMLRTYTYQLRQAFETGIRMLAIMNHNTDGVTFAALETMFGIPTGKGQAVFNLVNGSIGSMQGQFMVSDAKNITEQVG